MQDNRIQEITIEITNKCNMRCRICNIWREKPRFIEFNLIRDFIKSVSTHYKIGSISLTGGEPFLHPHFEKILRLMSVFKKSGLIEFFDINTNGYATEKIRKLLEKNIDFLYGCRIGISLDGIKGKNSFLRGKRDAFEKTLETINFFKRRLSKIAKLKVKFTISKFNYGDIYNFYLFCLKNDLFFNPKFSEQDVKNYYHRAITHFGHFSPLIQENMRDVIRRQLEMILLKEKNNLKRIIDIQSFKLLIYLVKRESLPIRSCLTPAKCLFLTSEKKIFCCLNMKEIGTLEDGVLVIFGKKHKELAARGLRGNCPGCYAYHGFLNNFNLPFLSF